MKTFEQYLENIAPSGVHTNNDPEGYERWLESKDQADIMEYAEEYGEYCRIFGATEAYNEVNRIAKDIN